MYLKSISGTAAFFFFLFSCKLRPKVVGWRVENIQFAISVVDDDTRITYYVFRAYDVVIVKSSGVARARTDRRACGENYIYKKKKCIKSYADGEVSAAANGDTGGGRSVEKKRRKFVCYFICRTRCPLIYAYNRFVFLLCMEISDTCKLVHVHNELRRYSFFLVRRFFIDYKVGMRILK